MSMDQTNLTINLSDPGENITINLPHETVLGDESVQIFLWLEKRDKFGFDLHIGDSSGPFDLDVEVEHGIMRVKTQEITDAQHRRAKANLIAEQTD